MSCREGLVSPQAAMRLPPGAHAARLFPGIPRGFIEVHFTESESSLRLSSRFISKEYVHVSWVSPFRIPFEARGSLVGAALEYSLVSLSDNEPVHPFPTQLLEALSAYYHLVRELNIPPKRIILIGDSAGGHLALALQRYLLQSNVLPSPGGLILFSPWCDLSVFVQSSSHMRVAPRLMNISQRRPHSACEAPTRLSPCRPALHAVLLACPPSAPPSMAADARVLRQDRAVRRLHHGPGVAVRRDCWRVRHRIRSR